jgi:hypothetical protein
MRGDAINNKVGQFLKDNGVPTMKKAKPMENAAETIKKLREQSNKIVLITARGNGIFPGSEEVTEKALRKNEIEYDEIIYIDAAKKWHLFYFMHGFVYKYVVEYKTVKLKTERKYLIC